MCVSDYDLLSIVQVTRAKYQDRIQMCFFLTFWFTLILISLSKNLQSTFKVCENYHLLYYNGSGFAIGQ